MVRSGRELGVPGVQPQVRCLPGTTLWGYPEQHGGRSRPHHHLPPIQPSAAARETGHMKPSRAQMGLAAAAALLGVAALAAILMLTLRSAHDPSDDSDDALADIRGR